MEYIIPFAVIFSGVFLGFLLAVWWDRKRQNKENEGRRSETRLSIAKELQGVVTQVEDVIGLWEQRLGSIPIPNIDFPTDAKESAVASGRFSLLEYEQQLKISQAYAVVERSKDFRERMLDAAPGTPSHTAFPSYALNLKGQLIYLLEKVPSLIEELVFEKARDRFMRTYGWLIITFFIIVVISGVGIVLFKKADQRMMVNLVKDGQLVIDDESHHWVTTEHLLKIRVFLRNKSAVNINGNLVFSVKLDHKGLEEDYLKAIIKGAGEERAGRFLSELKTFSPKGRAISNYVERGEELPDGEKYEPTMAENPQVFSFLFRKRISLRAGEILQLKHEQIVPPKQDGYLMSLKLEGIEFDSYF